MGEPKFKKLLEPIDIGGVTFRNRIVKAAQNPVYADAAGYVTEKEKDFCEALARGGVGMLLAGAATVDPTVSMGASETWICVDDDKYLPGLAELAQVIHKHGCPTFLQLHHAGPQHPMDRDGLPPVSSSALTEAERPTQGGARGTFFYPAKELTTTEIEKVVDKFTQAARRAQKAGFDGVEIHAAHPYLINSFLSRAWNKRQDAYGCQDLESRSRFAVEIIRAIKTRLGQNFPVGIRINGKEYGLEKGITTEESQAFARILETAGADYIHVSAEGYGLYERIEMPEQIFYPEPAKELLPLLQQMKKQGLHTASAAAIKKVVSIPVISVGNIDPVLGEKLVKQGRVDLIGVGRRLLADPELPNKLASGRYEDIAPCATCMWCVSNFGSQDSNKQTGLICRINAALGRERAFTIKPAEKKKRVMIIGGGPAGMEAARVAAIRGHEVSLFERSHHLGGLLPLAALIKGTEIDKIPAQLRYLRHQITRLGVSIYLGKEVNPELIEQLKPDVAVVATGGLPAVPEIPGINLRQVVRSSDLGRQAEFYLRFLGPRVLGWLTRFYLPLGKRVVIIGGLIYGCETAEFLVKRGRKVTIVETMDRLGTLITFSHLLKLFPWFAAKGVTMLSGVKYEAITARGLTITTKDGQRQTLEADNILVALSPQPNTALFEALRGKVPEVHLIGDGREPLTMGDAIYDGSRIGRVI